jgi:hypothetical protein
VIPSADSGTLQQLDTQDPQMDLEALDRDPAYSNQQPSHYPQIDVPPPDGSAAQADLKQESKKRPRGNDEVEVPSVSAGGGGGSTKKKKKRSNHRESEQA